MLLQRTCLLSQLMLLSSFGLGIGGLANADTLTIDSQVKQVLVYPQQAWVQHQAQLNLPVGIHDLVFANLANSTQMDSIKFGAKGQAGMSILNQQIEEMSSERHPSQQVKALKDLLDAQVDVLDELADRQAIIDNQLVLLEKMQKGFAHGEQVMHLEQIKEMQKYSRLSFTELCKELRELAKRQKTEKERHDDLVRMYEEALEQQGHTTYAYKVKVKVEQAGKQQLDLSYYTGAVSWHPVYKIKYASKDHSLVLEYAAQVNQKTYEDWQGIQLSLSTGRAMQTGIVPELDPWYLHFREPMPPVRPIAATRDRSFSPQAEMVAMVGADAESEEVAAAVPSAFAETAVAASVFRIEGQIDVLSGEQSQQVQIATSKQTVKPEYAYYPSYDPSKVLMTVETENNLEYPLMPGNLLSYYDEQLVGTGQLPMLLSGQRYKQYLGENQTIVAKVESNHRFEENNGFINKTKAIRTENTYVLSNQQQEAVDVVVYDRIPSSQHEDIRVKLQEPKSVKLDELGRYNYVVTLKPKESQTVKQVFTVEYPSDKELSGF